MRKLALLLAFSLPAVATALHAQDWAKTRLDASPRHHEYVTLKNGNRSVQAFVVYPEIKTKAPVVILIHEIFGLSDWAKEMADELAASGYIVVAPDLLSGAGPNGGGSDAFPSMDATTKAVSGLDASQVNGDLDAAANYAKTIPAGNGKLAVAGFCWGGGKTFAFATHRHDISAFFVFYGPPPAEAEMKSINAPVYGFYAGNDARINATLPATVEAMKAAGKTFEPITYEGAGHGFMRAGENPTDANPANKKAREEGYARLIGHLGHLAAPKAVLLPVSHKTMAKKTAAKPDMQCHDMKDMGAM